MAKITFIKKALQKWFTIKKVHSIETMNPNIFPLCCELIANYN